MYLLEDELREEKGFRGPGKFDLMVAFLEPERNVVRVSLDDGPQICFGITELRRKDPYGREFYFRGELKLGSGCILPVAGEFQVYGPGKIKIVESS